MKTLLIGIGYRANSGKDTVAELLLNKMVTKPRLSCKIMHLGDGPRDVLQMLGQGAPYSDEKTRQTYKHAAKLVVNVCKESVTECDRFCLLRYGSNT